MNVTPIATLTTAFALLALLAGCDLKSAQTSQGYGPVSDEGIARSCTASPVDVSASASATATMVTSNEGGWCAIKVSEKDGQAFATGLVRIRPEHGRLYVEKAGAQTRVQYYPAAGYAGADTFTIGLRSRSAGTADATVKVNVTVSRAG